ncbi:uncharacterized protein V1516DRAFT_673890 [Lipomyces oligophaga]|uniref:uncharacterized protein n=1 Tax=Lipomyces oligophaga TaxID=45792 RepID=UPI0034CE0687
MAQTIDGIVQYVQSYASNATQREYILMAAAVIFLGQIILISVKVGQVLLNPVPQPQPAKKKSKAVWTPGEFSTPTPDEYPDWDIKLTKPLPYRPFKHNYHVTMGIRSMNWDDWIELDNEFLDYHERKKQRLTERDDLVATDPTAYDSACELLEEFRDWLPNRYPSVFKRTAIGIDNIITGESFNTTERPLKRDPMEIAALLVQDDLAIMLPGPDKQYYLKAGCILLAGFWRLKDKLGMPLSEIHTSGDVPQFREKLQVSMERFFVKLRCEKPVVRNNYFIQTDNDLGWSNAIGPEDSETIGWYTAAEATDVSKLYFRSERQSLRRLPISGGVVFTIRTYFVPIVKIAQEPYVPGRLADGIRAWADDVSLYKGKEKYGDLILSYLDEQHKKQLSNGLDMTKEPSVYPF